MSVSIRRTHLARCLITGFLLLLTAAAPAVSHAQADEAAERGKQRVEEALARIHQVAGAAKEDGERSRAVLKVLAEVSTVPERIEVAKQLAATHGLSAEQRSRLIRISNDAESFVEGFAAVLEPTSSSVENRHGRREQGKATAWHCRTDWGCAYRFDPLGACTEVGWDFWPAVWTCAWAGWITWSPSGLVFHDHCQNEYCT